MQEYRLESLDINNIKIQKKIKALISESRFTRSNLNNANCELINVDNKFKINTFEDGQDPKLSEVQKLFNEIFPEEEIEPETILRSAVDGQNPWGTPDTKYRVVVVTDEDKKITAICAGATLDIDNKRNEVAYCVEYVLTKPQLRQSGLAREAYISALIDSMKIAKEQNKKLTFLFGGCTDSSETFWNNMGWKRIYFKKGSNYIELPYLQPILNFDTHTGEISNKSREVKEHLMIDCLVRKPTKEDMIKLQEALINYTAMWPREAFKNNEAFIRHKVYIDNLKLKFREDLDQSDNLYFFDKQEAQSLN